MDKQLGRQDPTILTSVLESGFHLDLQGDQFEDFFQLCKDITVDPQECKNSLEVTRATLEEECNLDVGLFFISNKVKSEEFIKEFCGLIRELQMYNCLMISVGIICTDSGSNDIFNNLDNFS